MLEKAVMLHRSELTERGCAQCSVYEQKLCTCSERIHRA